MSDMRACWKVSIYNKATSFQALPQVQFLLISTVFEGLSCQSEGDGKEGGRRLEQEGIHQALSSVRTKFSR